MESSATSERRELAFAGVARQAELVRAGEVSPRELVETALERIGRLDRELNAFRVVFDERALAEADKAGRRTHSDDLPLLGVPIAVKDDMAVAGTPRVIGSNAHGPAETEDCELVRLLRAAGAIVIGVARTPELALWPFTETAHGGITRNPWDLQRLAGRVERRAGAAVAAGLVAASTALRRRRLDPHPGGVLRALRPEDAARARPDRAVTRGLRRAVGVRLPRAHGRRHGAALRGRDGRAVRRRRAPRAGQAAHRDDDEDPARRHGAPEARAARRGAGHRGAAALARPRGRRARRRATGWRAPNVMVRYLRRCGRRGRRDGAPRAARAPHAAGRPRRRRRAAHAAAARARGAGVRRAAHQPDLRRRRRRAEPDDDRARRCRSASTRAAARRGRSTRAAGFVAFNPVWNHIGNPAAAVPAGFDDDGLPLSVQIAGRPDGEETLLSLAHQLETARPWADARPPVS